ncbi:putative transcription factor SOX-15 [Ylistrum balloti]|uniref:putative transcription factor SOX-15 n=1 Tax=Ylistrum balloti TaxID=509963 RepID=UPI002905B40C|nr:putative transcription factor SOX-15 [Ylistrum balloti]
MTEQMTKRTIGSVDRDVSYHEDMFRSKKLKVNSDEGTEQTAKQQHNEDRNNSNCPVKVKVNVSECNKHPKVTGTDPTPYRIVVSENHKDRNFDDEAQKASTILKNIVMEKMNDRISDSQEHSTSAFQGVQQHNYQPMVPLTCKIPFSRPIAPIRYLPVQSNVYPQFVRHNATTVGNLASLPAQVGMPRMVQQPGKTMVQPIPPVSSVTRTLLPTCGALPTVIPTSTGTATQSTGTMTSINDPSLPSNEYFSNITSPAIKTTVQVMPGTSMMYKTPGATFRNRHGKVKRPMNAFMVWARNYRSRLSEEMPQASNAQISVRLGEIWGSMSLAEKEKFFREAERIKLQHNRDFPGWVYQPKQKKVQIETQHDRLWARFGSNSCKEHPTEMATNPPHEVATHQIVTPTPVTVYPKTSIVNTSNVCVTSPLPSFSQLTQTVTGPKPILSMETEGHQTSGTRGRESFDKESIGRPTAFKSVSSSQTPVVTRQVLSKKEHGPTLQLTSSAVCQSPLKMTASSLTTRGSPASGNVRSLSSAVTGCPSPKGRPPSISRRIPHAPEMLISTQRSYREAIFTKSNSISPPKTKSVSSGPILSTSTSDTMLQKANVTPLTTTSDVRVTGSHRGSADPVDELWPFPLPSVEQTHHVDVLYDDHLRYERDSGTGFIDPYNPFYYDGSYDETRSGLQVDVNSWQKYLNYTKMQSESEDKTNLTKYFPTPPPLSNSSSSWCDQIPTITDHSVQQEVTRPKQTGNGSDHEPRRTSSESCFASSLTSAINVLDDVSNSTVDYADGNHRGYQQSNTSQPSADVADLQYQNNTLQALDLSSGTRAQTSASNIVYLGQETAHIGSGDGVGSIPMEAGSPPGKSEDSRPLKKRIERYRKEFINGRPYVTAGDVPTGTYLEDVVFLTSPEKAAEEEVLSGNLSRHANGYTSTDPTRDPITSQGIVIDVAHDFVKSLKSGAVITDLTPVNMTNVKSIHIDAKAVERATNQNRDNSTERMRDTEKGLEVVNYTEPCKVNIKEEVLGDH